ncbi:MAG: zinc ribbon domain-containing protein [Streptosporangiaceae bacterium]
MLGEGMPLHLASNFCGVEGPASATPGGQGPGRLAKVNPAFTSQRCSAYGHVDKNLARARPAYGGNADADVNAARSITAGCRECVGRSGLPGG